MDAISFVLGVKSAQLRSSQLKEVIFRGRRLAAQPGQGSDSSSDSDSDEDTQGSSADANKATVTAVYEDTNGREWRFQRSITLAGASEYRVNGKVVSWAFYNATLEKFNILVKAKNFLVFQGDVEAVAAQNSRDLARLIEQISGSLELKEQYEQAKQRKEKAAEQSTAAYNKRRGINGELKTFREQKQEAEKWARLQEERDAHILDLLLWQLYHIKEQLTSAGQTIDDRSASLKDLRRKQTQQERNVENRRKEAASVMRDIAKVERDIKKSQKQVEEKQPSLDALDERTAHSQGKINAAQSNSIRVNEDLAKAKAELAKLEKDHASTQKAAKQAEEAEKARAKGPKLSEADLDEYRNLRAEAATRRASERQQLEVLRRKLRTQQDALQSLQDKYASLEKDRARRQEESSSAQESKNKLESQQADLQSKLDEAKKQIEALQAERIRIGKRETELNNTLQSCYTKLNEAGTDAAESEREQRMKEAYATLARMFPGVRGRLVDLCKPTQNKYDLAITTVLGRNVDSLVVDHEKTAIDCIEYLRNQRIAQVTFLPLDALQPKPVKDKLRTIARGARLAIEVMQFDPTLERAMQYVCGSALVCDDLDTARHVSYEKHADVKVVTLDGTVIHRSGLIAGGQTGERGTKRWEERDAEKLYRQRDECMAELKALGQERRNLSSEDALTARVTECETMLVSIRDELSAANSRLKGFKTELSNIDKQLKELEPRIKEARSTAEDIEAEFESVADIVASDDDDLFGAFCARIGVANIREYEETQLQVLERQKEARLEFETHLKRLERQMTWIKSSIAFQEERLATNESIIQKESGRLEKFAEEKAAVQASIDEINEGIAKSEGRLAELREEYEAKSEALSEAKREMSKAGKAVDNALKEIAHLNDERERLASQRTEILRRCRLEEIDLPLLSGSLSSVPLEENQDTSTAMDIDEDATQRALDVPDYGIEVDFSDLDEAALEDGSASMENELKDRVDKAVEAIEKMAPNMKAADRLDDTEVRFKETEVEFEQARREAVAATTVFNDVKKRRCDLFNKAFNHISNKIDSTYKDLTKSKAAPSGGVAYLSLEDTEEPYLSGVKYHAMPPMKRFRDMDQLSGGEKTMAALALLFCIATYAPPPFFVLDEVDAALDSQNVARVAAYIRKRARPDFQFVVISHKAALYEQAEGLVGIYREIKEEQNSSATLTLDLEAYRG